MKKVNPIKKAKEFIYAKGGFVKCIKCSVMRRDYLQDCPVCPDITPKGNVGRGPRTRKA